MTFTEQLITLLSASPNISFGLCLYDLGPFCVYSLQYAILYAKCDIHM